MVPTSNVLTRLFHWFGVTDPERNPKNFAGARARRRQALSTQVFSINTTTSKRLIQSSQFFFRQGAHIYGLSHEFMHAYSIGPDGVQTPYQRVFGCVHVCSHL